MKPRIRLKTAALAALGAAGLFCGSPAFAAVLACDQAAIQAVAPGATIVTATPTAAPVPHCRVDGYITTTNPGPNKVNFRLQLPDQNWNGRYFFIGMGGSAGFVPSDSQIPAGNPIVKGFAVAGTDTGRQGSSGDWDFIGESEAKALDHHHRAGIGRIGQHRNDMEARRRDEHPVQRGQRLQPPGVQAGLLPGFAQRRVYRVHVVGIRGAARKRGLAGVVAQRPGPHR